MKNHKQHEEHNHAPNENWDDEHYPQKYEVENREFFGKDYAKVQSIVADALGTEEGMTAADVGAGTGFVTEVLIARKAKVFAVDSSDHMLGYLEGAFGSTALLECIKGEAEKLPFADATVDAAIASMVIHHLKSPSKCIHEMRRVVRPGGKIAILEMAPPDEDCKGNEKHAPEELLEQSTILELMHKASLLDIDCKNVGEYLLTPDDNSLTKVYIAVGRKPF